MYMIINYMALLSLVAGLTLCAFLLCCSTKADEETKSLLLPMHDVRASAAAAHDNPAQTVYGRGWADMDPYKDTESGMTMLDEIALEEGIVSGGE